MCKKRKIDVGIECQKITQTREGGYKSKGKYTKPNPHIFLTPKRNCSVKDAGMDKALYVYLHLYIPPSLFVLVLACHPTSLHFSFLVCVLFWRCFNLFNIQLHVK